MAKSAKAPPSVETTRVEGAQTVILREPATGSEARVVTDVGNNVTSFRTRVGGETVDVLATPDSIETLRAQPSRWGNPILFPYPGRIRDGRFDFEGRQVRLPTDPRDGHAIHGVVRNRPWRVMASAASPSAGAWVTAQLDSRAAGVPEDDWPFPFSITVRVALRAGALRLQVEVVNTGETAMPMGLGFHPYVPTPLGRGGSQEETEVWIDAAEEWLQEGAIPTGEIRHLEPDAWPRRARPLGEVPIVEVPPHGRMRNACYRRQSSGASDAPGGIRAGVRDRRNGVEAILSASAGFGALVFFTPAAPPVVSLEPHTCVPDAFNLASRRRPTGMVVLGAGECWRGWIVLQATVLGATRD